MRRKRDSELRKAAGHGRRAGRSCSGWCLSRIRLPPLSSTAESAPELVRPALCVQAVAGRLHVFLPYTPVVADYLDLVAAVEDTCASPGNCRSGWRAIRLRMISRLRSYGLTPDPGVLEVNLPRDGELGRARRAQCDPA